MLGTSGTASFFFHFPSIIPSSWSTDIVIIPSIATLFRSFSFPNIDGLCSRSRAIWLDLACEFSVGTRYVRRADQDPLTGDCRLVTVFTPFCADRHPGACRIHGDADRSPCSMLREKGGGFVAARHCEFRFDLASAIVPLEIGLRGAWLGPTRLLARWFCSDFGAMVRSTQIQ